MNSNANWGAEMADYEQALRAAVRARSGYSNDEEIEALWNVVYASVNILHYDEQFQRIVREEEG